MTSWDSTVSFDLRGGPIGNCNNTALLLVWLVLAPLLFVRDQERARAYWCIPAALDGRPRDLNSLTR